MKSKWKSEKELAKVIVDDLRDNGWKVYPEICDIDIVAVKEDANHPNGLKIIGVECKRQLNLTVLSQAYRKRVLVDQIYVGVPHIGYHENYVFGLQVAKSFGFGVYLVESVECPYYKKHSVILAGGEPPVIMRVRQSIDKVLDPKAENFAEAGQMGGKSWTLFKKTVSQLVEYVEQHEGCSFKEALSGIQHHYKNDAVARSCLSNMIKKGVIKELCCENGKLKNRETK